MNKVTTKSFKINKRTIKSIIEKSGYLLEQRICPLIEKRKFYVEPNEQFQDQDTGKSREIDIYAQTIKPLYREDYLSDIFNIILLIECKTNSTPLVFFTQKNPIPESIIGMGNIQIGGYPNGIYEKKYKDAIKIEDYFHFEKFHHNYKVKRIAKQFCKLTAKIINKGSRKEKIEWGTSHEGIYNSIESLVKATKYYVDNQREEITLNRNTKDAINLAMICPILLFSGPLYECRIQNKGYKIIEANHLVLYKSVRSKTLKGTYHVDVIKEDYLNSFLRIIEKEEEEIIKKLKKNRRLIKENTLKEYRKNTEK